MSQIRIPWDALSENALTGVIDEFVTREGTEYGAQEVSLESKRQSVMRQLKAGEAIITWDDDTGTCSIEPAT